MTKIEEGSPFSIFNERQKKRGILINTEKKEDGQLSKERETFEILLEQINAGPNLRQHPLIQTAQIKQVVVHRQSKAWTFYLQFDTLLPVMVYQSFKQHLELAFKEIAAVRMIIEAKDNAFDQQLIQEYWPLALANQNCDRPLVQQVIKNQLPVVNEKK